MVIVLRDYQKHAVDAVTTALRSGKKRILVEAAPGTGKSIISAEICRLASSRNKVLVMCHNKDILKQNGLAVNYMDRSIHVTFFCDGLGEKDLSGHVVMAHRDSLSQVESIPEFKFVIIDEAHMLSTQPTSRYQIILERCNAHWLVGMTATPYRLSGGKIYGKKKQFEIKAFDLGLENAIRNGFLTPYKFVEDDPQVTVEDNVRTIDYDILGAYAAQREVIKNSVRLIKKHTKNLKCTIIYCCSRAHAKNIHEALMGSRYIDGETKKAEREKLLEEMRAGLVKYVVNVNVLTTGTDIPLCDGIVMLRPTLSASLYVQAIGRALRLHPSKTEATVIELTDNLTRFGDLNDPMHYGKDKERPEDLISLGDDAPTKQCPSCEMEVSGPTRVCPHCDYLFLKNREEFDNKEKLTLSVTGHRLTKKVTKKGADAIVVTFYTPIGTVTEWLNIENENIWVARQARAKLKKIKKENVNQIVVKGINEKYPRVLTYHTLPENSIPNQPGSIGVTQ